MGIRVGLDIVQAHERLLDSRNDRVETAYYCRLELIGASIKSRLKLCGQALHFFRPFDHPGKIKPLPRLLLQRTQVPKQVSRCCPDLQRKYCLCQETIGDDSVDL